MIITRIHRIGRHSVYKPKSDSARRHLFRNTANKAIHIRIKTNSYYVVAYCAYTRVFFANYYSYRASSVKTFFVTSR